MPAAAVQPGRFYTSRRKWGRSASSTSQEYPPSHPPAALLCPSAPFHPLSPFRPAPSRPRRFTGRSRHLLGRISSTLSVSVRVHPYERMRQRLARTETDREREREWVKVLRTRSAQFKRGQCGPYPYTNGSSYFSLYVRALVRMCGIRFQRITLQLLLE
jgi:hypothetical protein